MKYYYRILDISPDSSLDKIKEQYHLLIFAWHPDRHPEKYKAQAEEKSKDINEAYKVLSDTERRKTYDMQLKAERARERSSPSSSHDVKEEEECCQREEAQAARQYAEETGATYQQSQVAKKLCEQGVNKHNKKDYQAAIADYTQAIALDPQYGFAHHSRGRSWAALGEHRPAIADYTQAIALDPQYAPAYNSWGVSR